MKLLPGPNICCTKRSFTFFFISVLLFAKSSTVKIFHSVDLLFLRIPTLFPISCICRNFSSHTWSLANISATDIFVTKPFFTDGAFFVIQVSSPTPAKFSTCSVLSRGALEKQCDRSSLQKITSSQKKITSIKFWMGGSGKGRGKQVTVGKFDFEWYVYKQSGTGAAAWELRRYLLHLYKAVGVLAILRLVAKKNEHKYFLWNLWKTWKNFDLPHLTLLSRGWDH